MMKIKLILFIFSVFALFSCSDDDKNDNDVSNCFSPTSNLEIAYTENAIGCDCDSDIDEDICVSDGTGKKVALVCSEGKWIAVEDGPCGDEG